jgi:hypothetical protein
MTAIKAKSVTFVKTSYDFIEFKETRSNMSSFSVSNTHTQIFTRIPKRIEKTWTTTPVSVQTSVKVPSASHRHEHSILNGISLIADFNELLNLAEETLTDETDKKCDRIQAWQEARKDWVALESAIEAAVNTFVERARMRSASNNMLTVDVLANKKSKFVLHRERLESIDEDVKVESVQPAYSTRAHTVVDSGAMTIRPGDSVSAIGTESIEHMIQTALQSMMNKSRSSTGHSHHSSRSSKHSTSRRERR